MGLLTSRPMDLWDGGHGVHCPMETTVVHTFQPLTRQQPVHVCWLAMAPPCS